MEYLGDLDAATITAEVEERHEHAAPVSAPVGAPAADSARAPLDNTSHPVIPDLKALDKRLSDALKNEYILLLDVRVLCHHPTTLMLTYFYGACTGRFFACRHHQREAVDGDATSPRPRELHAEGVCGFPTGGEASGDFLSLHRRTDVRMDDRRGSGRAPCFFALPHRSPRN